MKVLITARVHPYLVDYLTEKGYSVLYRPAISYDEAFQSVHGCEGLIVTTRIPVDKRIIDNGVHLQWVARLGSGMELIDVEYANSKGIRCVSSPEGNADAVGEQALGMLLCVFSNILKSNLELRQGIWEREKNRGYELGGKVVGIIGYGHTGSAFAHKLRGLNVEVLAYDKYKTGFGNEWIKEAGMEEIFHKADVVSLHLPLTGETHHLANTDFFNSFTGPVYLINTSRGAIVNTEDLISALKEGRVAGACLDVLENEHLETMEAVEREAFQFLLYSANVVLTPHIAGYSQEASLKMAEIVLKKLGI